MEYWFEFYLVGGLCILRRIIKDGVFFFGDLFVFSYKDIGIFYVIFLVNK